MTMEPFPYATFLLCLLGLMCFISYKYTRGAGRR